jgi:hypothetical protein
MCSAEVPSRFREIVDPDGEGVLDVDLLVQVHVAVAVNVKVYVNGIGTYAGHI